MTKNLNYNGFLIGQVFDFNTSEQVKFPTPEDMSLQMGYGFIPEDKLINTHIHKRVSRNIDNTSEFLYVISGEMKIDILTEDCNIIESIILKSQMGLLQFYGGHTIFIKGGTQYFEIKQGPYLGKNEDKFEINI